MQDNSTSMNLQMMKISLFAIVAGIFAVLYCGVNAYSLVTPIMSVIVGQAAHALGVHKRTVNILTVFMILTFLIILPYLESHPAVWKKFENSLGPVLGKESGDSLRKSPK